VCGIPLLLFFLLLLFQQVPDQMYTHRLLQSAQIEGYEELFTAFSQSLHILQSALIEEDGVYTFDQELAEKAGG
jgi:hypothetical protein